MHSIEILVFLILLFMGVPDLCRWLRRPALAYPVFVVFGLAFSPLASSELRLTLEQVGQLGFLLLLFEVGLEIDLPKFGVVRPILQRALGWALLQYPIILCLAHYAGLSIVGGLIACAALTGCSVGMGHAAWKTYPGLEEAPRQRILLTMLSLEIVAIVLLSGETMLYTKGFQPIVLLSLAGVAVVIYLISRFASHMEFVFNLILQSATHWRMHLIVLAVLIVCALGQRIGLSATKTAFFLGLFMSRIRHDDKSLEDHIAPISRGFLIPVFFFALGIQIEWSFLFSMVGLTALGTAALLIGWRMVIHRRLLPTGGDGHSFLLLCPNLTIAALASQILIDGNNAAPAAPAWIVLTGLFMSVTAIFLLPRPGIAATTDNTAGPATDTTPSSHA